MRRKLTFWEDSEDYGYSMIKKFEFYTKKKVFVSKENLKKFNQDYIFGQNKKIVTLIL